MKKLIILVVLLATLTVGCTSKANINQTETADLKMLEKNLQDAFAKKTEEDIRVQVNELKNLKEELPGFAFVEIKVYSDNDLTNTERVITNGKYIVKDIVDSKTFSSLNVELEFEFAKPDKIDTSKLTLAGGKNNSENVIVEITDFQCQYCKKANDLLKNKLKDKSNYALYLVHLPILNIHPNAQIMAQVFEAGMQMGFNFKNDLFESDYFKVIETKIKELQKTGTQLNQETLAHLIDEVNNQITNDFAVKTDNPDKFKALVNSDEIKAKIDETKKIAEQLNVSATPTFYINGKGISGYQEYLILKALKDIK